MKKLFILIISISFVSLHSQSLINKKGSSFKLNAEVEGGFIGVLNHTLQNGKPGTNFNYKEEGGQDILFPIFRYQVGLNYKRSNLSILYQPLELITDVTFKDDVIIDGTTFTSGTPMELTYSFPFWRFTYLYTIVDRPETIFSIGGSLQLRNASIKFKEIGGVNQTVSQNLGPVPAISLLYDRQFKSGIGIYFDLTGSYANSSFFNGASYDFEGSLLDGSVKIYFELQRAMRWYVGCRFLGGSATGNSENIDGTWTESSSSYTDNQLATIIFFTGVRIY